MIWVLLALLAIAGCAGVVFGRRYLQNIRLQRMADNEYKTALALKSFADTVKRYVDELNRGRVEALDFSKIKIPHSAGYRISLELTGWQFRVRAVPDAYNKTGRLSLYVDEAMKIRAMDRGGDTADASDPEYSAGVVV